jgi:transcriptional regulator with GAF, ATPase, and Fis domain
MNSIIRRVIGHIRSSSIQGDETTLVLAELYQNLTDSREGLEIAKSGADIMRRSGQKAKAAAYYDRVLRCLSNGSLTPGEAVLFVDAVIGKTSIMTHRTPVPEQIPVLTRAEEVAEEHSLWDRMPRIKLWLGRALQDTGQHKLAARYINDFLRLSERIEDAAILKSTSHWVSEYFTWSGRFSEATRRYEQMVGDLEEFGDDEMALMSSQIVGLSYAVCGRVSRGLGMVDAVRTKAEALNLPEVVNYCDQTSAAILIQLRKIPEAEFYLNRLSSFSDETLGPFLAWTVCDHRAFILCSKQDFDGAFKSLKKKALLSRSMGRSHSPFPSTFETLSVLESKGFVDEDVNMDSLLNDVLNWDDIFTKGLALRHRALRRMEAGHPDRQALSDLHESERLLRRSGARIELARTRIALGKYHLSMGETKTARQHLSRAWEFFSTIDSALFPHDLLYLMPQEQRVKLMVERMTRINESLGTLQDMPSFLEKVIDVALDLTMAMRGAFVVPEPDGPRMIASRNLDRSLYNTERFRRVVDLTTDTIDKGAELIIPPSAGRAGPATTDDPLICMPARLGGEVIGHLVLDGRLGSEPFPEGLVHFVRMLASQIAVGLANIRTYEELRKQKDRLEEEAVFYKKEMGIAEPIAAIVGSSDAMKALIDQIRQVAATDSSVLILGETGVGKELVAKAIHGLSKRMDGPFIPVNLAALPQELTASELFGHDKGAFTGAHENKKGRFELADGGTIFLDEIGDLAPQVQVKLLRVLQEGIFERVGGTKSIRSDFRVIAATNKDLRTEVEQGTFRQDLYYRLNVFPLNVPPLRERKKDIPPLTRHFADRFAKSLGRKPPIISQKEMGKLLDYGWPGNIRELEHFIERAVILSGGGAIMFSGLEQPPERAGDGGNAAVVQNGGYANSLATIERDHILRILAATGWRVSGKGGAAAILQLKASTLRFRMAKLGIKKPDKRRTALD